MTLSVDQFQKLCQPVAYPRRVTTTIQDGIDPDKIALDAIVDCEGEPPGQKPMVSEMKGVNTCVESKALDVREN